MSSQTYLEQKWRAGFRYMDTDSDGFITEADMCAPALHISKVLGLREDDAKNFQKNWVKWFYYLREDPSAQRVSEDRLVAGLAVGYEKNLELMKGEGCISYSELFDVLDTNKDGKLSLEELEIYYQCHNVTDKGFVKKVFDKLDLDGDGYIQRDELIKAGINFWWNADPAEGYGFIYDRPEITVKKQE